MKTPAVITKLATTLLVFAVAQVSLAQEYVWAPDFPVGASIPAIEAQDQNGEVKTFDELKGEKGLLLLLNRSFDW